MLRKLTNLYDTRTMLTDSQHFTLFEAMDIVNVVIAELGVLLAAIVTHLT